MMKTTSEMWMTMMKTMIRARAGIVLNQSRRISMGGSSTNLRMVAMKVFLMNAV